MKVFIVLMLMMLTLFPIDGEQFPFNIYRDEYGSISDRFDHKFVRRAVNVEQWKKIESFSLDDETNYDTYEFYDIPPKMKEFNLPGYYLLIAKDEGKSKNIVWWHCWRRACFDKRFVSSFVNKDKSTLILFIGEDNTNSNELSRKSITFSSGLLHGGNIEVLSLHFDEIKKSTLSSNTLIINDEAILSREHIFTRDSFYFPFFPADTKNESIADTIRTPAPHPVTGTKIDFSRMFRDVEDLTLTDMKITEVNGNTITLTCNAENQKSPTYLVRYDLESGKFLREKSERIEKEGLKEYRKAEAEKFSDEFYKRLDENRAKREKREIAERMILTDAVINFTASTDELLSCIDALKKSDTCQYDESFYADIAFCTLCCLAVKSGEYLKDSRIGGIQELAKAYSLCNEIVTGKELSPGTLARMSERTKKWRYNLVYDCFNDGMLLVPYWRFSFLLKLNEFIEKKDDGKSCKEFKSLIKKEVEELYALISTRPKPPIKEFLSTLSEKATTALDNPSIKSFLNLLHEQIVNLNAKKDTGTTDRKISAQISDLEKLICRTDLTKLSSAIADVQKNKKENSSDIALAVLINLASFDNLDAYIRESGGDVSKILDIYSTLKSYLKINSPWTATALSEKEVQRQMSNAKSYLFSEQKFMQCMRAMFISNFLQLSKGYSQETETFALDFVKSQASIASKIDIDDVLPADLRALLEQVTEENETN
ncbi:MAG TPA: hypothetical protein PLN24_00020 [Victivallales bacterium]|nr:hypothetical protein [Victivallales bacterium]